MIDALPATSAAEAMLVELHTATAEHGQAVRDYMLGALSAHLNAVPGGREAWTRAVADATACALRMADLRDATAPF